MYNLKLKITLSLIMVLVVSLFSPLIFAQQATSSSFDKGVYYQGDNGSLSVTIFNNHASYQISTKQCYLQFDWQQSQNLVYDSGATPIIASGATYTFSISFSIPSNMAIGYHQYKVVWVDKGILLGSVVVQTGSLYVHDAYEKVFLSLQPTISSKINSASYASPDAKSLLNQAQSAYQQAIILANQGKFQDAITDLNSASDFLSRAQTAEATYQAAYNAYQSLLQSIQTKLNQATGANYKSPDAQSLLSQAQTYYSQATNSANSDQLQDANSKLTSASDLLDQATAKEEEYITNNWKDKAQSVMTIASQKIDLVKNCEGTDSKSLLQKAQQSYASSQTSFSSASLTGYQNAFDSANQAISFANQAKTSEDLYQQQKQQQQTMIVGGVIVVIVIGVTVYFLKIRKKPVRVDPLDGPK
jgi:HEPN domain-containing protein